MHNWQSGFRRNAAPALKAAGKFALIGALNYGPAGLTGWAVKSVARKPLKIVLAWALEPLIRRALRGVTSRWNR
ncbi:phage shock protein PspD [Pantoea sp. MBD-2R]|uniref:phage shock protein PspD n=1 Tax=unclassified Pantoea TaxID=2630326 RepID=UPI0011BE2F00|nr:phage shock protein PspD [Pantoea sp. CCBC3-3-1]